MNGKLKRGIENNDVRDLSIMNIYNSGSPAVSPGGLPYVQSFDGCLSLAYRSDRSVSILS